MKVYKNGDEKDTCTSTRNETFEISGIYLMRNDGLENLKLTGYTDDRRSRQNNRENLTSFLVRSVIGKLSGQI